MSDKNRSDINFLLTCWQAMRAAGVVSVAMWGAGMGGYAAFNDAHSVAIGGAGMLGSMAVTAFSNYRVQKLKRDMDKTR